MENTNWSKCRHSGFAIIWVDFSAHASFFFLNGKIDGLDNFECNIDILVRYSFCFLFRKKKLCEKYEFKSDNKNLIDHQSFSLNQYINNVDTIYNLFMSFICIQHMTHRFNKQTKHIINVSLEFYISRICYC